MKNIITYIAASVTTAPCDKYSLEGCPEGGGETELFTLINQIVTWLTIAIGILSVVFIIISAIQIMTSGGDAEKVKRGRRTLLYSIIGLIVAILAGVIISLVFNIADSI